VERLVYELGIIRQAANDGMLLQQRAWLLLGILTLEQFPDGTQPKRPMGSGHGTGFFQRCAGIAFGQAQEPLQHTDAFDATGLDHALGPVTRLRTQAANLAQQPGGAALDGADLLCSEVLPLRAEVTRLVFDVEGNLLEAVITDPYDPIIPTHPDLPGQLLGRHRVIGSIHFDVPIAMHRPLRLVKERETLDR
jgi:hypothetical protein